jgi:hypothetical protein
VIPPERLPSDTKNTKQFNNAVNTGSIRYDSHWTSMENSLELIELSSTKKVSLVSTLPSGLLLSKSLGTA